MSLRGVRNDYSGWDHPELHHTITYSVDGHQYIAVLTGYGISQTSGPLARVPDITPPRGHNAIYVFALP